MQFIKLDKSYRERFYDVWKAAFDDEFDDHLCDFLFNQENLWEQAYGWIEDGELISTYLALDVKVLIRNKEIRGHYIDGIATLPSKRGQGLVHQAMLYDAQECLQQNIPLMLTDPSRDSFYRKFGFEFALENFRMRIVRSFCSPVDSDIQFTVKSDILMKNLELQSGYKEINHWLWENSKYNEMKWPGCYEEIKFQHEDLQIAMAFDERNQPSGYILFTYEDSRMTIESFRYMNLDAFYALKQFMLSVDEEITEYFFLRIPEDFPYHLILTHLGTPELKQARFSWISRMARIADFQWLLQTVLSRTPQSPIRLQITDHLLPDNNGVYTITPDGMVTKEECAEYDLAITITDVVPLITGLKSAEELYYAGKLKVGKEENVSQSYRQLPKVIQEMDYLLPKVTTFCADEYLAP